MQNEAELIGGRDRRLVTIYCYLRLLGRAEAEWPRLSVMPVREIINTSNIDEPQAHRKTVPAIDRGNRTDEA